MHTICNVALLWTTLLLVQIENATALWWFEDIPGQIDGLESRIAALEARATITEGNVTAVTTQVATLETNVGTIRLQTKQETLAATVDPTPFIILTLCDDGESVLGGGYSSTEPSGILSGIMSGSNGSNGWLVSGFYQLGQPGVVTVYALCSTTIP